MKVLISGNAGAGKSSLGKKLAEKYYLPLYGLDKIVWKENWERRDKDEREKILKDILVQDSWVIEGITRSGLKEADIVYFLDINRFRCAFNVIVRLIKNGLLKTRPGLPRNCPEWKGSLLALKTVFIFHKVTKPWLLDEFQRKAGAKFIHLKSYNELIE